MVKKPPEGRGSTDATSKASSTPFPPGYDQPLYTWADGQRYRWVRYKNRYHISRCMFYAVLDPEE
jgi:hypothetical protein